jgi:tRNA threonylcarbamoyladenosine biosynthesis protein TsaE
MTLDLPDLAATESFGRRLAALLFPGAVVGLVGPLGAGKTKLARAVAEALGADPHAVSSPTFVLLQEYAGQLPIYHFDAYRLSGPDDLLELGAEEYLQGDGVCLVEWADRVGAALPEERLTVTLTVVGESVRQASVTGEGARYRELVQRLASERATG